MNVADYMQKEYPAPPCWSLVADVFANEREQEVDGFKTVTESIRQLSGSMRLQGIAEAFRLALHKNPDGFRQVDEPEDFALVLMGKTEKLGMHHAGVYYGGKVLHAQEAWPVYQDLASLQDEYRLMQFWAKDAA